MRLYLRLIVALPLGSWKSSPRGGETFIEANAKTSLFFGFGGGETVHLEIQTHRLAAAESKKPNPLTHAA